MARTSELEIQCSECHHDNHSGRRYCMKCGQSLYQACPECECDNAGECKFCGGCGKNLGNQEVSVFSPMGKKSESASVFYEALLIKSIYSQDVVTDPGDEEATDETVDRPPKPATEPGDQDANEAPSDLTGTQFPFSTQLVSHLIRQQFATPESVDEDVGQDVE